MKKKIKSLIPILFIAARRLTVRSYGYPCKNPSKEQKGFYRKNQRGEDAAKQLRGYKNTLLYGRFWRTQRLSVGNVGRYPGDRFCQFSHRLLRS